jgi:RNA polymerase sigma-70 factor, ECF subfamily
MLSTTPHNATFEELALPLLASLYNHAFWHVRNHAEAENLVQEAFSKALPAFDSFQPSNNFEGWIFRILHNTFLTSRTGLAASRTVFLEDQIATVDIAAADPSPEDYVLRLNNETALQAAPDRRQAPVREVLPLCNVEEIKYKDIALILNVSIGIVMSRISRAWQALRQLLQPQFGEFL